MDAAKSQSMCRHVANKNPAGLQNVLCSKYPKTVSRISILDVTDHNKNLCSYCSLYLPDFREVLRSASAIFVHTMYVTELELTL